MARTVGMTSLALQVRQRADMQNSSGFIGDSELYEYINQSIADLYDLIIAAWGQDRYMATAGVVTASGVDTYPLPSDFYLLRGVDAVLGGNYSVSLRPFMFNERNLYKSGPGWLYGQPIAYRLEGSNIVFLPQPTGVFNVTLWYIPAPTRLVVGSETGTNVFDGVSGWEEYVVVDAAIKCLQKEESDPSVLMARKQELKARIEAMAPQRDAGAAERVTDVTMTGEEWP